MTIAVPSQSRVNRFSDTVFLNVMGGAGSMQVNYLYRVMSATKSFAFGFMWLSVYKPVAHAYRGIFERTDASISSVLLSHFLSIITTSAIVWTAFQIIGYPFAFTASVALGVVGGLIGVIEHSMLTT